jgi:hypothetical protein
MAMRMRPSGSQNPLQAYAPAFDISNLLPGLCKGAVQGLLEENLPSWFHALRDGVHDLSTFDTSGDALHGALLLYIRSVKRMQVDADVNTVDEAFAAEGFDAIDPLLRAVVMARVMDYVNAAFMVAIKDATRLVEGGTPVRADVQAALDAAEAMVTPARPAEDAAT